MTGYVSPYLEAPCRSLADLRRELQDKYHDTLRAWFRGDFSDVECERQLEAMSRRLSMIAQAESARPRGLDAAIPPL